MRKGEKSNFEHILFVIMLELVLKTPDHRYIITLSNNIFHPDVLGFLLFISWHFLAELIYPYN